MVLTATWYVARYYRGKQESLDEIARLRRFNLKPESVRADSEFFEAQCPDSQFAVFMDFDNTKKLIGHGFRMDDHLIMPAHVLGAFHDELWITRGRRVKSGWTYDTLIRANRYVWKPLMADVVYAEIGNENIPGLKKANITPYWGSPLVSVATYFDTKNCSIGQMKPSSFGMLEYSGSTRNGFSGAVYMLENKVAAMHLGGGVANIAVAASYLKSLLYTPESSEIAALKNSLKRARKEEVQWATTGDPDTVQVHVRGRYYRVDRDEFDQLYDDAQDAWDDFQEEYERKASHRKKRRDQRDVDRDLKYQQSVNYDYDDEAKYDPEGLFVSFRGPSVDAATQIPDPFIFRRHVGLQVAPKVRSFSQNISPDILEAHMPQPKEVQVTEQDIKKETSKAGLTYLTPRTIKCVREEDYAPEADLENFRRPTHKNWGGPSLSSRSRTPSPSRVDHQELCMMLSAIQETLSGLTEIQRPSSVASGLTTSIAAKPQNKPKRRRSRNRKPSQLGSPKDVQ